MTTELSKAEFAVLKILWKEQPLSVREVHDQLNNGWAYTTTKTVMDRMGAKGLLSRGNAHGVNIYRPLISRVEGVGQWIRYFADNVLDTSYDEVLRLVDRERQYSPEEMEELAALLEQPNKNNEQS